MPQAVLADGEIKVGVTVSLTGKYEEPGREQYRGIQMWASDLNARGALLGKRVKVVYYDDKSDRETSAGLYQRLITEDKVDLLIGPYSSGLTLAASEVAEQHEFPMVAAGAASDEIWERGYRNIFGIDTPSTRNMEPVLEFARDRGLKNIALFHADNEFPREVAKGVRARVTAAGLNIVFDEEYPRNSTDFAGLVERMAVSSPDIVIGGTYLDDSVAFVRQAKKSNLQPKAFVFTVGPALTQFGDALGADAEGIMGVVEWIRSDRLPAGYDFSYRYERKYGRNPGHHAAYGYSAGQVLEAAVRLAGSLDKDRIREQLGEMKFRSLLGHYRVDETGKQIANQSMVLQWQDGRRRLILPQRIAESPARLPIKPWSERQPAVSDE
jgi:branched-chain amino acid transport system substrate-binding protein